MPDLEPKWPAGKVQVSGDLDQRSERHPFERHRMPSAKRVQVDAVAVIRANHGQAGEPAFSCFGLLNNREVAPAAEIQKARHVTLTLSRGSRIEVISERAYLPGASIL